KRRKLGNGTAEVISNGSHATSEKPERTPFVGLLAPKQKPAPSGNADKNNEKLQNKTDPGTQVIRKLAKDAVIFPKTVASSKCSIRGPDHESKESLNPRALAKSPALFVTRRALLLKVHEYMAKLNDEVSKSSAPDIKALHLTDNAVVRLALDEEEKIAIDQPSVYANIIKMRIVALKKMKLEEWVKGRKEALEALARKKGDAPAPPKQEQEPVNTGLSPHQEVEMLSRMISSQNGLAAHGYVTQMPTDEEVETARKGVESSANWEVCDRCTTRFQVFPDRREDGALTTGGKCIHHWGRRVFARKQKTDAITGGQQARYSCCNEIIGAPGCTVGLTHVFKISESKRLAAIMQFKETPFNPDVKPNTAVCFDCEMGYTCYGLELIRITATSWPSGDALLDVLVRPLGAVLDLNSRFSGVHDEQFLKAKPFDPANPPTDPKDLGIVNSPYEARELLLSYVSRDTPLLGHALENDLNAVRLIHPAIVDTALLFPHPRGLPIRYGLRVLSKMHLDWDIQQGGATGHDSLEDARATGELVRFKVAKEWKKYKDQGWEVREGKFCPPLPSAAELAEVVAESAPVLPLDGGVDPLAAALKAPRKVQKRTRAVAQLDGADDEPEVSE
ncbi:exonuclease, partial [Lepidopterella palustris CBS 459.81]